MSNEVKKEKRSAMGTFLKSSVGKLAILAGAMSLNSCELMSVEYSNSNGYQECTRVKNYSTREIREYGEFIFDVVNGNGRWRGCRGTVGNKRGFLGNCR